MRPAPPPGGAMFSFPRPGKALVAILVTNFVAYVLFLILLRAEASWVNHLALRPVDVFTKGYVWQPLTYLVLHMPESPGHLLFNMLWLYLFGVQMEPWWGSRRFVAAYVFFGLSGAIMTLIIGALAASGLVGHLFDSVYLRPHLGASGAVTGMIVAWGIVHANQTLNFMFLGPMKGKTFVLIIVAMELLVALSLDPTSSTSHFGGMMGAAILATGMWRPSSWGSWMRRAHLSRKRRQVERDLRVIPGGKSKDDDPSRWN